MERPPDKAARRLQALASAGCDPKQNCLGNSHWNEFAKCSGVPEKYIGIIEKNLLLFTKSPK